MLCVLRRTTDGRLARSHYHLILMIVRRHMRLLLPVLAIMLPATAPAVAATRRHQACTGGQISAIDQYCETIPAATGPHAPQAGSPALAAVISPRLVRRIAAGPYKALLNLPSSGAARHSRRHQALTTRPQPQQASEQSLSTPSVPLVAILALLAALLVVLAALRRRRRQRPT